jgi:hypothetical protein
MALIIRDSTHSKSIFCPNPVVEFSKKITASSHDFDVMPMPVCIEQSITNEMT